MWQAIAHIVYTLVILAFGGYLGYKYGKYVFVKGSFVPPQVK